MFLFSSYWQTWNRILIENKYTVELNITPVNGWAMNKDRVTLEVIRLHWTARSKNDQLHFELPELISEELLNNVGPELFDRLINFDYLSEIKSKTGIVTLNQLDSYLSKLSNGGGVPFKNILSNKFHLWT